MIPSTMLLFLVFFLPLYALATAIVPVKVDSDTLNYVMLGDWGGQSNYPYYTTTEKKIAASMGAKAQEIDSQFTIALGDNFYGYGVKNVDDPRFQTTFEVIPRDDSIVVNNSNVCVFRSSILCYVFHSLIPKLPDNRTDFQTGTELLKSIS